MKPSSPGTKPQPPSRAQARNAALMNLLATPGLGSLLAGRRVAGAGQLLLAVAGFLMLIVWFVRLMMALYSLAGDLSSGSTGDARTSGALGWAGLVVFAGAWLWSLVTSVQLLRAVRGSVPTIEPPKLG